VIKDVLLQVLLSIVETYEKLLALRKKGAKTSLPLTQQEALQAVFNIKYTLLMIPWKEDTEVSNCEHG
jgi:hypothetical protein